MIKRVTTCAVFLALALIPAHGQARPQRPNQQATEPQPARTE